MITNGLGLEQLNVVLLIASVLLSAGLSYFSSSLSYYVLLKPFNKKEYKYGLLSGFVGAMMDKTFSIGGVPGVVSRILIAKRHLNDTRLASKTTAFHFYIYRMVSLGVLLVSLMFLPAGYSSNPEVVRLERVGYFLFPFMLLLLFFAMRKSFKKQVFRVLRASFYFLNAKLNHKIPVNMKQEDEVSLLDNVDKTTLLKLALCVIGDWFFVSLAIVFIFRLLGVSIGINAALISFIVGSAVGGATPIPGGLGVIDGIMIGILSLYGVNPGVSLQAIVIFRIVYNLLPFLMAILFVQLLYGITPLRKAIGFLKVKKLW